MAAVQEIPPPEVAPARPSRWALPLAMLVLAGTLLVVLSLTTPRLPGYQWRRQPPPPASVNPDSLVAVDDRFALLSGMTAEGVILWALGPGEGWQSQVLSGAPSQLATLGNDLLAHGIREGGLLARSSDEWVETSKVAFPEDLRSRQESGKPAVMGDDEGILAVTLDGEVWWAGPGQEFTRVVEVPDWGPGVEHSTRSSCAPPSRNAPDIPPLAKADYGYIALVSQNPEEVFGLRPVCEPRIWVSETGETWSATPAGFDDAAYVYDVAWRGGLFIAVGGVGIGEAITWSSPDGLNWEVVTALSSVGEADLFSVEAGEAGWIVLGRDEAGFESVGWTSTDGRCWEPVPLPVRGWDAAVARSRILVLDRGTPAGMWTGTPTGERGICR